ncbi:hypothetical protein PIB30_044716 [Stylosanthes scabra]|uniref:Uncharacterized protein n=1 Tax=Stylosanthes scabra TaxID=79078 RepID=A0ABU6UEL5_9FABA|nr:hypothetical protein [Stylosanthes scabra]
MASPVRRELSCFPKARRRRRSLLLQNRSSPPSLSPTPDLKLDDVPSTPDTKLALPLHIQDPGKPKGKYQLLWTTWLVGDCKLSLGNSCEFGVDEYLEYVVLKQMGSGDPRGVGNPRGRGWGRKSPHGGEQGRGRGEFYGSGTGSREASPAPLH